MQVGMIVNPKSGRKSAQHLIPRFRELAASGSSQLDVRVLNEGARIEEVVQNILHQSDVLVVIGGDGSFNGVINGVMASSRPNVPVALIPAGRGNDSARSMRAFSRGDDLETLFDVDRHRYVDVGRITFSDQTVRRFINIASMGLSVTSAEIASRLPRLLGKYCYLTAAGLGLLNDKPFDVQMVMDSDQEMTLTDCRMIAVANGQFFGSGLHIAPYARVDDGVFDVVVVRDISKAGVLINLPRLRSGSHVNLRYVEQWKTSSVSILSNCPTRIECDGETGYELPAQFDIEPGALTWIDPS